MMRVAMVSKALVVDAYRSKLVELQALGIEVRGYAPSSWIEEGRPLRFERSMAYDVDIVQLPIAWNGHFHLHYYPTLASALRAFNPDIVHVDEEPYNLATFLAFREALHNRARPIFFAWQNIQRRYPPPFRTMETWVFRHSSHALAGSRSAERVLRSKGFRGELSVIPQFGVDTERFSPGATVARSFTVGYLGRLVPEKGIADLISAFERLPPSSRLIIAGDGPQADYVEIATSRLKKEGRLERYPRIPSNDVPALLRRLDVLVLPSRTTARWTEQYGRVLIEAMASGVPVVGSSSGEIPEVIGPAGLTFPEGDVAALTQRLLELEEDETLRNRLASEGRQRVLSEYSQKRIASKTFEVYEQMMSGPPRDWRG